MTAPPGSRAALAVVLAVGLLPAPLPTGGASARMPAPFPPVATAPGASPAPPAGLVPAQTQPGRGEPGADGSGGQSPKRFTYLNPRNTDRLDTVLRGALVTCGPDQLELRYRIDCIRFYFMQIADELPRTGDYVPVRRALAEGAAKLDAIVRRDLDPGAPALRPRVGGRPAAPRTAPIRAVSPEAAARAARAAQAVIDETSTILLRSTENSEQRMAHYQQIATAIGLTKVLLRSG